jgi:hypothetical protein
MYGFAVQATRDFDGMGKYKQRDPAKDMMFAQDYIIKVTAAPAEGLWTGEYIDEENTDPDKSLTSCGLFPDDMVTLVAAFSDP